MKLLVILTIVLSIFKISKTFANEADFHCHKKENTENVYSEIKAVYVSADFASHRAKVEITLNKNDREFTPVIFLSTINDRMEYFYDLQDRHLDLEISQELSLKINENELTLSNGDKFICIFPAISNAN